MVTEKSEIIIRRPEIVEIDLINEFFNLVLRDTFKKNGISELKELLGEEIEDKKRCINQDFETMGKARFFLLAEYKGEIVGTIEYGVANELLKKCTNNKLKDVFEIGTAFVHPKYQNQGIISLLFNSLFKELSKNKIEEVCFDSGYKIAQKIWCKKFGNPEYYLKDFWGEGDHHMVWRLKVKEANFQPVIIEIDDQLRIRATRKEGGRCNEKTNSNCDCSRFRWRKNHYNRRIK